VLRGAIAAALTPLRDGGTALDEDAFEPYAAFLAAGGVDGILALGTTGEGILLDLDERRRAAELWLELRPNGFAVALHCGAQTTADTVVLAEHAAANGADAVAVIGPPYFALDDAALLAHFAAAAAACAPTPFYVYEFAARSGYAVPVAVLERLRERAPNLAGLKVSDAPWDAFAPYVLEGLDVFVGPEALIARGLAAGSRGSRRSTRSSSRRRCGTRIRRRTSARSVRRCSGSRSRRRRSSCSAGAACRCGPTCARRCGG
jgi:N-acetylneuraminate lyase